MNTKNYLPPTKRYRTLISSIHSIYRLVNSTYDLKDLIFRLTKLIAQILESDYCLIIMLDPTKKFSSLKSLVSRQKRFVSDKKSRITNHLEKRILKTSSVIRNDNLLAAPLISDDLIGVIIIRRAQGKPAFERFDQEILMTLVEQSII